MGDNQEIIDKRALRRKRRIRNQILAYIVLFLFLIGIAAGAIYGVQKYKQMQGQGGTVESSEEVSSDNSEEPSQTESASESESEEIIVPPEEVGPTAEELLERRVEEMIEGMTLEDKVAGLFIVTPESITGVSAATKAGDGTRKALEKYAVGGLIYFAKNIKNADQFKEMIAATKDMTRYELFYAIDEEGGKVARLGNSGLGTKVEAAGTVGAAGDVDAAYNMGVVLADNLVSTGLNLNLAPVADITVGDKSFIGDRSFGSDPITVGEMVAAVVQGLHSRDVSATLKHFPGIGSTTQDPHAGLASTDRTEEQFRSEEFVVFKAGIDAGADMIMISNIAAPALTGNDLPCVFSEKVVTDILRKELEFDGVIITDAMDMSVVSSYYGADEAAIMALKAGCDMILMPENFEKAYNGVLDAVKNGTIAEERINDSLKRIYLIRYANTAVEEQAE